MNAPLKINVNVAGLEANVLLGLHVHSYGINTINDTLRKENHSTQFKS